MQQIFFEKFIFLVFLKVMEEWQIDIISSNKAWLITTIDPNAYLLAILEGLKILSQIELEILDTIGTQKSKIDQAAKLLDYIVRRDFDKDGRPAFDAFVDALQECLQNAPACTLMNAKLEYISNSTKQQQASKFESNYPALHRSATTRSADSDDDEFKVEIDKPSKPFKPKGDCYTISPDMPGLALILSIKHFTKYYPTHRWGKLQPITRPESKYDEKYMHEIWKGLGYEIYKENQILRTNGFWTKEDFINIIEDFRNYCNNYQPESIVVFISSYGKNGAILTSDIPGLVPTPNGLEAQYREINLQTEIISHFQDKSCPTLINKPKVFFVNGCNIAQGEQGITSVLSETNDLFVYCTENDFDLVSGSTNRANRFVHCLTFVLRNCVKNKHLKEMMEILKEEKEEQIYCFIGTVKKLYFPIK